VARLAFGTENVNWGFNRAVKTIYVTILSFGHFWGDRLESTYLAETNTNEDKKISMAYLRTGTGGALAGANSSL
jgi:hypothetical protein